MKLFGSPKDSLAWVTDNLVVGPAPMSRKQLEDLREQGVTAILNLCGEFTDLHDIEREHGFEVYYLPVADEEAPELVEMEKALAWLDEAIYLGKKVYIHCRFGIGRTGTVLNAYLLRRGLGSRLASRTLKRLRAKPESFSQWRTLRRYGKQEGRLTVRQPQLEYQRAVDLSPFLGNHLALVRDVEDRITASHPELPRCGRDHDLCSSSPVILSLVEAVALSTAVDSGLDSEERIALIQRGVKASRRDRALAGSLQEREHCLIRSDIPCPLWEEGGCLLFDERPLVCRTHGLEERFNETLWSGLISPSLDRISKELYLALAGELAPDTPLTFSLSDVVSGKYVEFFFHAMLNRE